MKTKLKYLIIASIVIIMFFDLAATSTSFATQSAQYNVSDLTKNFLFNVVGLNLTKYTLVSSPWEVKHNITQAPESSPNITDQNPIITGDLIKETHSYFYKSEKGTIDVLFILYNGQPATVEITPLHNASYLYTNPPENNLTIQSATFLAKYSEFLSQTTTRDVSYLETIRNMLSSLDIKTSNTTIGNITFQIYQSGDEIKLKWIYTENNVVMNFKRVEIDFKNNDLVYFHDSWWLFKVAGLSVISAEQAKAIALDAAQKFKLQIQTTDGVVGFSVPDLANAPYEEQFTMEPCNSRSTEYGSKLSLAPWTLYPVWGFKFYFNQTIVGNEGVEVAVLGTTSEVLHIEGIYYLGASSSDSGISSDFVTIYPGTTSMPNNPPLIPLVTVVVIAIGVFAVVIGSLFLYKRH
jgi:hypothetical protein